VTKLAIAALIGTLALAACGGASSAPAATSNATSAPAAATAAPATKAAATAAAATAAPAASAPAAAGPARKVTVGATNSLYSISTLEVKAGEKIEFALTNSGDEKHNLVAIGEGLSIVSPDFDSGAKVSWIWTAPTKPQTFKFICAYHKEVPPILITVK
jgi:plastocyanin